MKGFIVYPTYRMIENQAYVYLFGRLENGQSFLTINKFKPYFFIKKKDEKKAKKLATNLIYDIVDTKLKNFDDEQVSMVSLNNPKNVPGIRDVWHENKIGTYEADIRFVSRFLIDHGLKGSIDVQGDYEKGEKYEFKVDRVYKEPKLKPITWTPKLKVLSFDIENDKDSGKLFAISLYTDDYKKVLINKKGKFKNAESFDNEQAILERFKELVVKLDPDIITGWNMIDYDLDFLERKFKEYKIPFVFGRTNDICKLRRYDSFMRDSTADCPGREILDGMQLIRMSFIRLENNKLNTAAKEFLGEEKLIEGPNKYKQIMDAYNKNTQKLIDYNLLDSKLVYDILEKSGVLALTIQRSLVTGMNLERVKGSVASFDNLYLSELRKRNIVASSGHYKERERRITGGYVMDSIPGIYDYVIVCDFKSLYPSLMKTFNIDPWAYVPKEKEKKYKKSDLIIAPNKAKFRREIGIIPDLLEKLWKRRDEAKKNKNDLESNALKILMNSMFGVLANPNCRFYSWEMANAITHFGQHFIKLTAKKIEEQGYKVIYSDTDSVFIDLNVDSEAKASKTGKKIQDYINKLFKDYIKKEYKLNSYLELEFEKIYKRFLMPKVRSGEGGAKKRYAGLVIKGKKETLDFVGLEFVRRDWTELSKKFQLTILDKIFHKQDPTNFIKKFVTDLKKGKYNDLLVYRKALRKDVEEYTKTTPPHVKAARLLGTIDSNIIEYVMTSNGPEPIQKVKHAIDYEHYIEKQLKPIADSVLLFYKTSFDDVLKGTKQTKLSGF